MLLKRQQEKVTPFYKLFYKMSPQREKNLKKGLIRRLIFRIFGEIDNLTDLQTVKFRRCYFLCRR